MSAEVDGLIVFEGSTKKAQRVLVTGNAGAGKTTLAKDIARRLDIPFYSLDSIVWQSGWKKTPSEERTKMIESLVSSNTWIIDGVSVQVQERADMVIFIDLPRRVSFIHVCRRNWRYLFRSRPELPPNCPEILIIPKLFKIIWVFPSRTRLKILEIMSEKKSSQKQYHLKCKCEVEEFLSDF